MAGYNARMTDAPPSPGNASLTRSPAWRALTAHRKTWNQRHLRDLFIADAQRFPRFSRQACGLLADFSKQHVTAETLGLLLDLARERGLRERFADLVAGRRINPTEKRAAWHTALRAGEKAPRAVTAALEAMRGFSRELRESRATGATGKPFSDVVSLGIGGSALGPALATAALAPQDRRPRVHFASVPGEPLAKLLATLDPAATLFIVQSKSFSTLETLRSAEAARRWLRRSLGEDVTAHFSAVTAEADAAAAFGIARERIFPLWDWVGGRYSLWSAVGLPAMIAMGAGRFDDLLAGAAAMDGHALEAAPEQNIPLLLALIDVWNTGFFGAASRAVMPYAAGLALLPAWLQQLEMESLGKSVDVRGKALRHHTGPVLWGGLGTEAQHACFQWLHQGTHPVPVDFIACCETPENDDGTHAVLIANCFAQSALLMRGVDAGEAREAALAAGATAREAARLAPHQSLPGNRPSTTLLLPSLDARSLGALLALCEHRTFFQSAVWNINAFDQYGVEHGKRLAGGLLTALSGNNPGQAPDASTAGLIEYFLNNNRRRP